MKYKFKPFLLWGGVFLLISFVSGFVPYLQDVSLIWMSAFLGIGVLLLIVFPQTNKAERFCKQFPNLSSFFLYSGWVAYALLPVGLIFCWVDFEQLYSYSAFIQAYVWLCLSGLMISYLAATLKIVYSYPKVKPFLLFGGLYQPITVLLNLFFDLPDNLIITINIFALIVVLWLIVFPQTDKAERLCKKFPNLSLYVLYSGWLAYMALPMFLIPWLPEAYMSETLALLIMTYVFIYGLGIYISYLVATVVVVRRLISKDQSVKMA